MDKSIFSKEYGVFLQALKAARVRTGKTQGELAIKLGRTQSFVSKCERGERRLDLVELRAFCQCLGIALGDFMVSFEAALTKARRPGGSGRPRRPKAGASK